MKPIRLKESQEIGDGGYGIVYRISQRRVVKVFFDFSCYNLSIEELIQDEIAGTKKLALALPVLKVIDVLPPGKKKPVKALLKRYIPYRASSLDIKSHRPRIPVDVDNHEENFRKDSRGKLWRIDTQTCKVLGQ